MDIDGDPLCRRRAASSARVQNALAPARLPLLRTRLLPRALGQAAPALPCCNSRRHRLELDFPCRLELDFPPPPATPAAAPARDILLLECYVTKDIEFMFVCFCMMLRDQEIVAFVCYRESKQVCVNLEAIWLIATINPFSVYVAFNLSFVLILP